MNLFLAPPSLVRYFKRHSGRRQLSDVIHVDAVMTSVLECAHKCHQIDTCIGWNMEHQEEVGATSTCHLLSRYDCDSHQNDELFDIYLSVVIPHLCTDT